MIINSNEPDDSSTVAEDRFRTVWPKLQAKLCPSMVPNITLGVNLFSAARYELGLVDYYDKQQQQQYTSMYDFDSGGFIYTPPSGERKPIVYLRIWKAANNQIRYWSLKELKPQPGTFVVFASLNNKRDQERRNITMSAVLEKACIVTAVRDPISHFLSGYNEIETRLTLDSTRIKDPHPLLYTRYQNGTNQRFQQFVTDFIGSDLASKRVGVDPYRTEMAHVYSMVGILYKLAQYQVPLTSYLPSISNLTETWPKFLANTCPSSFPPTLANKPMEKMEDNKESLIDPYGFHSAARDVWKQEGITARALCAIHAMDYACFENLPDGIPSICKDVFSSNAFLDQVMAY